MQIGEKQPLVSIVVVTYNSAKFVLETLESAKYQTYQDIEVIITDDNSTDNTLIICNQWLSKNSSRFIRTEVITSSINTGITANCNRGLNAAKGKWIKFIAGDDILFPDSISEYMSYLKDKPNISFLFSDIDFISEYGETITSPSWYNIPYNKYLLDVESQYRELIMNGNFVFAPTSFINRLVLLELKGFDERIPDEEDYSLWIKATKYKYKLFYHSIKTVKYRIHGNSISNSNSPRFKRTRYLNFIHYRSKYLFKTNFFLWYDLLIIYFVQTRRLKLFRILKYTSALYLFKKIKR